ncbi:MAG: hypothetical protein HC896_07130 [Bacteroidales bacterium]|nr:hypothetical protein [Bacteroidales bacterium]
MFKLTKFRFLFISFIFIALNTIGQTYKFKNYDVQNGICDPYVYTINQDNQGFIWVGTGEGLCRFDGFNFVHYSADSLKSPLVTASYLDGSNRLWFGYNDGTLAYIKDGNFNHFKSLSPKNKSKVTAITSANKGVMVATQNDGIFNVITKDKVVEHKEKLNSLFLTSLARLNGNVYLAGHTDGMSVVTFNPSGATIEKISTVEKLQYISIKCIFPSKTKKENFWVGTEDQGLYKLTVKNTGNDLLYNIEKYCPRPALAMPLLKGCLQTAKKMYG